MLTKDLISDVVPFLRPSDTGRKALTWMEIFRISHLPIVQNDEFLGLIADTDIFDFNMADEPVGDHRLSLYMPFLLDNQHIYEAFNILASQKLTIVPVLDRDKKYLGVITLHDLLKKLSELTAMQTPGGIIELEMHINDYSLSQIAQITESNNAKILSLYVSDANQSMRVIVTIKLNTSDIASVIQTFERYSYDIRATYTRENQLDDINHERIEALMRYLQV